MPVDVNLKKIFVDRDNDKGITLVDLMRGLGYYKRDKNGNRNLGLIVTKADIDKWSFRKATPFDTDGERITDVQIRQAKCGLTPISVEKILATSIGTDASASHTMDEGLAEIAEWTYRRPRGGAYNEPFRVQDFDGYNGLAVAPDSGWGKITFVDDAIDELANATITVEGSGYDFRLTPSTNDGLYSRFAMKFSQASGVEIGNTANMDIAISDVASLDGNYRIALAVWIPNFGTDGGWGIFASRMVIGQYTGGASTSLNLLYPDFATNPYAMYYIKKHYTDTNTKDFLAVPLLVKDLGYIYQPNPAGGSNPMFCLRAVSGVTEAYCMPSGQKDVSVYFDIVSAKDVEGAEVVKFISPDGWYLAYRFAGTYTGSGSAQKSMYTLFIGSVRPITENVTVFLKCTVHFIPATTGATAQTQTIEQSFPISAGATTTIHDKTYYGINVRTMPALYLYESDVETFTVTKS